MMLHWCSSQHAPPTPNQNVKLLFAGTEVKLASAYIQKAFKDKEFFSESYLLTSYSYHFWQAGGDVMLCSGFWEKLSEFCFITWLIKQGHWALFSVLTIVASLVLEQICLLSCMPLCYKDTKYTVMCVRVYLPRSLSFVGFYSHSHGMYIT